jgi:hypothetical protein
VKEKSVTENSVTEKSVTEKSVVKAPPKTAVRKKKAVTIPVSTKQCVVNPI